MKSKATFFKGINGRKMVLLESQVNYRITILFDEYCLFMHFFSISFDVNVLVLHKKSKNTRGTSTSSHDSFGSFFGSRVFVPLRTNQNPVLLPLSVLSNGKWQLPIALTQNCIGKKYTNL